MDEEKKLIQKEMSALDKKLGTVKDFNDFADKLQALIDKEEEELYSETVRNEYRNPSNVGVLFIKNGTGKEFSDCGDSIQYDILIENDTIKDIKFTATCGVTTATGSMLSRMVKGLKLTEAQKLNANKLTKALGGLPPDNLHASGLAIKALKSSIKNYLDNKN